MKKNNKNVIFLLILFITILIVSIASATFAYFASTVDANNTVDLSVHADGVRSLFNTIGASLSLDVKYNNMSYGSERGISAQDSGKMIVSYLSGSETETRCTYNIYYRYSKDSSEYTKVESQDINNNKEFTYEISRTEGETPVQFVGETNFLSSSEYVNPVKLNNEPIVITNSSKTEMTKHEFTITAKFYNIEANQNINSGKNFILNFYTADVVC